MKISVIMIDGLFREYFHLLEALNQQTLPKENWEAIWIEFYDSIHPELQERDNLTTVQLGNRREDVYHSSYCFNEGIRRSSGDVLVIMDADLFPTPSFLTQVDEAHRHCKNLALYFYRWDEPESAHDSSMSYSLDHLKRSCRLVNSMNYGGCLTIRKEWLLKVNGYEEDSAFSTLHANGADMYTRLKNKGLHIAWHPTERLFHPWHPQTLAPSKSYEGQLSIIRQRELNLSTLPNEGLDPHITKEVRESPVPSRSRFDIPGRAVRRLFGR